MTIKEKIEKLRSEPEGPCVSIAINTHRTHPDSATDAILLKNQLREAEQRVVKEFGKKGNEALLENIERMTEEINHNYNLDSLNLFLSNNTSTLIRSPWPVSRNRVEISDSFAIRSLIGSYNRSEPYMILVLSQNDVHLYEALNDGIIREIKSDEFPYPGIPRHNYLPSKSGDPSFLDDQVREHFNKIDKALVKVYNATELKTVVICTPDNYSFLMQVADRKDAYLGFEKIDYNNVAPHQVSKQGWKLIQEVHEEKVKKAVDEVKEAVSGGNVLTDLQEIYQAAIDGRGDLLIVQHNFVQPVMMNGERSFDLIENPETPGAIDDITSNIAWEVIAKKGRTIFTSDDDIKDLGGKIALKTRY